MRKTIARRQVLCNCLGSVSILMVGAATGHTSEKGGPGPGDKGIKPAAGTGTPSSPPPTTGGGTKGKDPNSAPPTKDRN